MIDTIRCLSVDRVEDFTVVTSMHSLLRGRFLAGVHTPHKAKDTRTYPPTELCTHVRPYWPFALWEGKLASESTANTPRSPHRVYTDSSLDAIDARTQQIDVMFLYDEAAVGRTYGVGEHFETLLADELPVTNEAAENSGVDVRFNLVHAGKVSENTPRAKG